MRNFPLPNDRFPRAWWVWSVVPTAYFKYHLVTPRHELWPVLQVLWYPRKFDFIAYSDFDIFRVKHQRISQSAQVIRSDGSTGNIVLMGKENMRQKKLRLLLSLNSSQMSTVYIDGTKSGSIIRGIRLRPLKLGVTQPCHTWSHCSLKQLMKSRNMCLTIDSALCR